MINFRYYRGRGRNYEKIEMDLHIGGRYITTVEVETNLLTAGVTTFPCSNGTDYKFKDEMYIELLEFLKEERKKITDSYPIKTLKGWRESGLYDYDDYCFLGDKVDEETVDYFIDCLPPTTYEYGFVQIGEPYNAEQDNDGRWRNTYTTFTIINGEKDSNGNPIWLNRGLCFKGQTENKVNDKPKIDRLISKAQLCMANRI